MKAIVIDENKRDWATMILDGTKTIETRSSAVFNNQKGERFAIISKKGSARNLVGFATISDVKTYRTSSEFDRDYDLHKVDNKSEYHIMSSRKKIKYGLVFTDVKRVKSQAIDKRQISGACGIKNINLNT